MFEPITILFTHYTRAEKQNLVMVLILVPSLQMKNESNFCLDARWFLTSIFGLIFFDKIWMKFFLNHSDIHQIWVAVQGPHKISERAQVWTNYQYKNLFSKYYIQILWTEIIGFLLNLGVLDKVTFT